MLQARALGGLRADVVALIATGGDGGAFPAAVIAVPRPGTGQRVAVDLWVEVEGAGLLGEPGEEIPETLRPEFYVYAIGEDGGVSGYLSQTVRIDLAEHAEALLAGGLKLKGRLELAPGRYELRTLVREPRSQRFVLRILPLVVPGTKGAPVVLSPVFADSGTAWIQVRSEDGKNAGQEDTGLVPAAFVPAALPVLATGREAAVALTVCGHSGTPRLLARLVDAAGTTAADLALRVAGRERTTLQCERIDGRFELGGVAAGNYLFEASLAGAEKALTTLQVYVPGSGIGQFIERGAGLQVAPSSLAGVMYLEVQTRRGGCGTRRQEVSAAYRKVIERLARSGFEAAVDRLVRLEEKAAGSVKTNAAGNLLAKAEGDVIARLAKHDPEVLLPLLVLHLEAHERYLADSQTALVAYARGRLRSLCRLYREKTKKQEESSRVLMAEGMALFGDSVVLMGMYAAARSVFEDALKLDEHNTSALVGMARTYERLGQYGEAASVLERLLDRRPQSDEARLRLALCRVRMDLAADAIPLLRQLIDRAREPWLVVLAYQELARIYLDRERFQAAVRLLEEAVGRQPSAERLYLALAYALERGGDRRGADDVLARAPRRKTATPRYTYGRRSRGDREESRRELLGASLARLPILQQALAAEARERKVEDATETNRQRRQGNRP